MEQYRRNTGSVATCSYCFFSHFLSGKGRFFRFRLPALPLLGISKQSLPQEDPDAVMVDSPRYSDGSVATRDYQLPTTRESCSPSYANDTRALIGPSHCSTPVSGPLDHSSPKGPWDRMYPDQAVAQTKNQSQEDTLIAAPSIPGLTPTVSRESMCSIRRASSVHDMEGFGSNSKMVFRDRHASEGKSVLLYIFRHASTVAELYIWYYLMTTLYLF